MRKYRKGKWSRYGILAGSLAIFLCVVFFLQMLLTPKYMGTVIEGNFTEEYYRDSTRHELLILGNCESYENISPMKLWEEYGITSYIRGNSNQLISQSYYLLREALRYEQPKVVLLNIQAMTVAEQSSEEYNRMVFDGMKWSKDKLEGILNSKREEESLAEYLFPILRYHSRWSELSGDDFRFVFQEKPLKSYQGYYLRADIRPYTEFPTERRRSDYTFPEQNMRYLQEIVTLCQENGIELMLMKAPSMYPVWVEPYEEQITEFAEKKGIYYVNTLLYADEIGIDMSTDTYDEGLHLNVYGAEKLSAWLGEKLRERYDLTDFRGEEGLAQAYNQRLEEYKKEKIEQKEEFERFGYISKYTMQEE
ncbi:MAG: SGNH/GDSL hydrolase family protein [Lachnospiraceae bacterium]|nr:SGNH/GDSL hydrolase family protein [Lachnospiraceae bacterium]